MTILYICGPMTGIPEFNYPAFNEAAAQLDAAGYSVVNPANSERVNPTPGTPQPWHWYMRHAIRALTLADAVALLPGWQNSRGANVETRIAEDLKMRSWTVDQWLRQAESEATS